MRERRAPEWVGLGAWYMQENGGVMNDNAPSEEGSLLWEPGYVLTFGV